MQDNKNFLGTEPIGKLLFKLSIPTVIAQLINMLYNIVDRIYIGHIPGDGSLALTGVGVCMPIIMIVSAFAALVSSSGAPRASIYMGRQDKESAEHILGNCFALQIIVSIVLTVILLIWSKDLLLAFGASENTISYATDYMHIYAFGTLFVQLTLGMNAFICAQGFTKTSMLSVIIGAVINIVLDPVFIFGFDMGVKGAAIATVIAQTVSALWIMLFLTGNKTLLHLRLSDMRMEAAFILPCLALGVSPFIMQFTESILGICFNTSLLKYGGDIAVGSMTVLTTLMQFCLMPMTGFTQGAQPITSYNFGAGNMERVRASFSVLVKSCLTYSLVIWAVVMLAPEAFIRLFNSGNPELIAYASGALRVYAAMLFLMGAQIACQQTFIAIGNAKTSFFLACLRKIILLIPLIYILPVFFTDKAFAVFLAEPVADFIAVAITVTLFRKQFKRSVGQS